LSPDEIILDANSRRAKTPAGLDTPGWRGLRKENFTDFDMEFGTVPAIGRGKARR